MLPAVCAALHVPVRATHIHPPVRCTLQPPLAPPQLFLEQNEEEAEKMEAKEEKQREIEKSQIKVRGVQQ